MKPILELPTRTHWVGDGATRGFQFRFTEGWLDVLGPGTVKTRIDGHLVDRLVLGSWVWFDTAPAAGALIEVYRDSRVDSPATFTDAARPVADSLRLLAHQPVFELQELWDRLRSTRAAEVPGVTVAPSLLTSVATAVALTVGSAAPAVILALAGRPWLDGSAPLDFRNPHALRMVAYGPSSYAYRMATIPVEGDPSGGPYTGAFRTFTDARVLELRYYQTGAFFGAPLGQRLEGADLVSCLTPDSGFYGGPDDNVMLVTSLRVTFNGGSRVLWAGANFTLSGDTETVIIPGLTTPADVKIVWFLDAAAGNVWLGLQDAVNGVQWANNCNPMAGDPPALTVQPGLEWRHVTASTPGDGGFDTVLEVVSPQTDFGLAPFLPM